MNNDYVFKTFEVWLPSSDIDYILLLINLYPSILVSRAAYDLSVFLYFFVTSTICTSTYIC